MAVKMSGIFICAACLSVIFISLPGEGKEVPGAPPGMVLVKGGSFEMGSRDIFSDEEPVYTVTLKNFYIGKFEVIQKEWQTVMGDNPSVFKGDQLPVEHITWFDAVEFCNKKSKREGLSPCYSGSGDTVACDPEAGGYRLPTEAEWEYACRGGAQSRFSNYSGSSHAGDVAWYEENSDYKTRPVGQKKSNELGIYDMSGNVREWCRDWYAEDYYQTAPSHDPTGPLTGKTRSHRGGSACSPGRELRPAARAGSPPRCRKFDLGLRLVRNDPGKPLKPDERAGMVFVKGGTFKMGDNRGKYGEKTVHRVTVNSFYIGTHEVTQEEWKAVMKTNPTVRRGERTPISYINWYDAVEYCNQRSLIEGLTPCYSGNRDLITCNFAADGYRLPTEAEWEYACRGGHRSRNYKYSGSKEPGDVAWYRKNFFVYFQPVGQKKTNELGIYDMSGNMGEWCWDWYDFDYYKDSPMENPAGPLTGIRRVLRGGTWFAPERALWSAARSCRPPYRKSILYGFRVVRTANKYE